MPETTCRLNVADHPRNYAPRPIVRFRILRFWGFGVWVLGLRVLGFGLRVLGLKIGSREPQAPLHHRGCGFESQERAAGARTQSFVAAV